MNLNGDPTRRFLSVAQTTPTPPSTIYISRSAISSCLRAIRSLLTFRTRIISCSWKQVDFGYVEIRTTITHVGFCRYCLDQTLPIATSRFFSIQSRGNIKQHIREIIWKWLNELVDRFIQFVKVYADSLFISLFVSPGKVLFNIKSFRNNAREQAYFVC